MEKRYQVFVSSTFEDLHEERQEVIQALLELNCIPSGMELFPAANEDQWTLIRRIIDDCDYYLVIIAGRYGSIGPDGLSYTEMEYRYALKQGKPIVAFIHRDPGTLPSNRTELSTEGRLKLEEFRTLAQQKTVRFWKSPGELGAVVSRSLIHLMQTTAARGWVRADPPIASAPSAQRSSSDGIRWDRTGNLYWLGADLMYTIHTLSSGVPSSVVLGLRQARHHLAELGMIHTDFGRELSGWLDEVVALQDKQSPAIREKLADWLDGLVAHIGQLAEEHQPDFKPGPFVSD
jgi:hypothetical protein